MRRPALLLSLLLCASCTQPLAPLPQASWRAAATDEDRQRLSEWRKTLTEALDKARAAGFGARIDAEGALLEPDAAIPGPLPDGTYHCRTIKLGNREERFSAYSVYPGFTCRVATEGGVQTFSKLDGAQRADGFIYPADKLRSVFLGAQVFGDETAAMRYGVDPDRNLAGWVERVGPERWRILVPSPRFESLANVIELTPA